MEKVKLKKETTEMIAATCEIDKKLDGNIKVS